MACPDVLVPISCLHLTDITLHDVAQHLSLWKKEGNTRSDRFWSEHKKPEILTNLAMVARFCLFQSMKVAVQFILRWPCSAVDACQHLVLLAAAPICASRMQQFEML